MIPFVSQKTAVDSGPHPFGRPLGLLLLVLYKGVWGLMEIVAGTFVVFSHRILSGELTEDPQDLLANWIFSHVGVAQAHRIGAVIVLLGAIKLAIAVGVWYRSWLMRNVSLVFLGVAAAFGIYEVVVSFTVFRLAALLVDLVLIYYFWRVLPRHLHDGTVS
ncbi:hypothetical protein COY93_02605 [Candidatus Uhrbacteria bacterium CG_4_10_14_0_8_um_filter_58_22]|uniref:DUF2127 domain-containing protein n=1 Tax=Candidatus Uhrbacteria bacterium CG_4_10_14_0_8_um_filter_58_22 TaxID=1975029 RepID=A0A2M7Q9W2_9BACT|nr:MAG: hypothetical protein AUJ19_01430 [Parcubacteria group bacterium CG1_02_58_44]PIY62665.1 MAG: hypothetical protein COY93_02605 [Candidatus Uhrbacteria bacterium CG_4_10_14_0_8_um_filter_58_22]